MLCIMLMYRQGTYRRFKNIKVEPLLIDQANLNTKRMLDLMALGQENRAVPLYMHTIQRILREMRLSQQATGSQFDYGDFKSKVLQSGLLPGQLEPLRQRLDVLESFISPQQEIRGNQVKGKTTRPQGGGSSWTPKVIYRIYTPCRYQ